MTIELYTDDYLVYASEKDRLSLATMRECESAEAAITLFNSDVRIKRGKKKQPQATCAVRIWTFEGTLFNLIVEKHDPVTLRWARDGKNENAKLAREIAKAHGVKLPKKVA
jgi:hypothetical protein